MEFVYRIENNLPGELCEEIIKRFEDDENKERGLIGGSIASEDSAIRRTNNLKITNLDNWNNISDILFENLKKGLEQYADYIFGLIPPYLVHQIFGEELKDEGFSIQSMSQNEFYNWHYDELIDGTTPIHRVLTCMWYLNTLDEDDGGCTEMWFGKKIKPKRGTLLIFPSSWPYIHRGAPIKNPNITKYTCVTWLGIRHQLKTCDESN